MVVVLWQERAQTVVMDEKLRFIKSSLEEKNVHSGMIDDVNDYYPLSVRDNQSTVRLRGQSTV